MTRYFLHSKTNEIFSMDFISVKENFMTNYYGLSGGLLPSHVTLRSQNQTTSLLHVPGSSYRTWLLCFRKIHLTMMMLMVMRNTIVFSSGACLFSSDA